MDEHKEAEQGNYSWKIFLEYVVIYVNLIEIQALLSQCTILLYLPRKQSQ